jgi:hypothetical protein
MYFYAHGEPVAGDVVDWRNPDWEPLKELAPEALGDFMWMFAVETEDGRRLHAYKHCWTRDYLHLDDDGSAFLYTSDGRYQEVDPSWLLEIVLRPDPDATDAGWWRPPGAWPPLPRGDESG